VEAEIVTRTNVARGPLLYAFTPLQGATAIVNQFYGPHADPSNFLLMFGLDDCELYTDERKAEMIRDYPEHQRQARAHGRPVLGGGLIFPIPWEQISVEPMPIPKHWPRVAGMDFGIEHATAATWAAWDRDSDTWYITDEYRSTDQSASVHAAAIRARLPWVPVAWPHDGIQRSKDTGIQLADVYKKHGVNMMPEMATLDETETPHQTLQSRISVEAGLAGMAERMETGRWKVFRHLTHWKNEYLQYHRVNGQVVKVNDDVLCSSRYAWSMRRFAITEPSGQVIRPRVSSWRT
jgi:hypothetical protein